MQYLCSLLIIMCLLLSGCGAEPQTLEGLSLLEAEVSINQEYLADLIPDEYLSTSSAITETDSMLVGKPRWLIGNYTQLSIPYLTLATEYDMIIVDHYLAYVQCFPVELLNSNNLISIYDTLYSIEDLDDYLLGYQNDYAIYIVDLLSPEEYSLALYEDIEDYNEFSIDENALDWIVDLRSQLLIEQELFHIPE